MPVLTLFASRVQNRARHLEESESTFVIRWRRLHICRTPYPVEEGVMTCAANHRRLRRQKSSSPCVPAPALPSGKLDPIALEIQWKRLVAWRRRSIQALIRTSFSVLVREANDFAVVLNDGEAARRAVDEASLLSGSLLATVKHCLDVFRQ